MTVSMPSPFKLNSATQIVPRSSAITSLLGNSGGITIYGSPTSTDNLTLQPNSASILNGNVEIAGGHVTFLSGNPNITTANGPSTPFLLPIPDGATFNFTTFSGGTGPSISVVSALSTLTWGQNTSIFGTATLFAHQFTHRNPAGTAITLQGDVRTFYDGAAVTAFGNTITMNTWSSFQQAIALSADSSASSAVTGGTFYALRAKLSISAPSGRSAAATLHNPILLEAPSLTGAGTTSLTDYRGIDIQLSTAAGTNVGIRNASATVFPPQTKTITAVGDSISVAATNAATTIRLNNTSGSTKTLTSTPTITDGQNGQILVLLNTSANLVEFQDQGTLANSNLRLVGTKVSLDTRESLTLMYSSDVGDWVQIAASGNVT